VPFINKCNNRPAISCVFARSPKQSVLRIFGCINKKQKLATITEINRQSSLYNFRCLCWSLTNSIRFVLLLNLRFGKALYIIQQPKSATQVKPHKRSYAGYIKCFYYFLTCLKKNTPFLFEIIISGS